VELSDMGFDGDRWFFVGQEQWWLGFEVYVGFYLVRLGVGTPWNKRFVDQLEPLFF
jgi:hypothetical protein